MSSLIIPKVALYARFSSDNQRTESIDAQIRAMKSYCKQQHWQIVATYIDEARSATTDNRPDFQRMISDSSRGIFNVVLVHKLDRFSRNRYDSAIYKSKLKKNNVSIASVLERIDDSPESVMMEAMLEGMAEYYSKNLSREVMKGMNETALQCRHTGGCTPLGYDLNSDRMLIINPHEAESVRIIFEMYDNGYGYSEIISFLNKHGYKTRKGSIFGKNSLYEILGNEKYTGVYIFNKASSKNSASQKRNNHSYKAYDSVVRVENGCPQIISKELFERVQKRRIANKRNAGSYHSREFYLCSGRVFCGICGKRMQGNLRFSGRNKNRLSTYRCNTHRSECRNKEVNKDYLDKYIAELLHEKMFNSKALHKIINRLNTYIRKYNREYDSNYASVRAEYNEICKSLCNLTEAIEKGIITESIVNRAETLEKQKTDMQIKLDSMHQFRQLEYEDFSPLIDEFKGLKQKTEEFRTFVQRYMLRITVFPEYLEIELNTGLGMTDELNEIVSISREELYTAYGSRVCKSREE